MSLGYALLSCRGATIAAPKGRVANKVSTSIRLMHIQSSEHGWCQHATDRYVPELSQNPPPLSTFVGVYWNNYLQKWQARVLNMNVLTSTSEVDCARAYDKVAVALRRIGVLSATPINETKRLLEKQSYTDEELNRVVDWWKTNHKIGHSVDTM